MTKSSLLGGEKIDFSIKLFGIEISRRTELLWSFGSAKSKNQLEYLTH
jgi:hypothetical protein